MAITLLAVNCPVNPTPSDVLDPSLGPNIAQAIVPSEMASLRDKLNENASRLENVGRWGGGAWGVVYGMYLTAPGGLICRVAAGQAMIDSVITLAQTNVSVPDNTARVHLWLSQAGGITTVANSLIPPVGSYCYLGSCVTAAGAVTSVDTSGVLYLRGGVPLRYTADTTLPTDSPSASIVFVSVGIGVAWLWDGVSYRPLGNGGVLPVASGGTGATTAAAARVNLGIQRLQDAVCAGGAVVVANGEIVWLI